MVRVICLFILFTFCLQINVLADSDKPAYNLFVDTDGSLDDFRAINMFLAGKDFNVLGVSCSQGTLKADDCFQKVASLLNFYHHEGIPAGIGNNTKAKLPPWNAFAASIQWGIAEGEIKKQDADQLLEKVLSHSEEQVTLVALGSLTTYAQLIRNTKQNLTKIGQIVWYGEPDLEKEFNYLLDKNAYHEIIKSGIPLVIVSKGKRELHVDQNYSRYLQSSKVVYAKRIYKTLNEKYILEKTLQGHSQLWDDLVPLYLSHPDLFKTTKNDRFANAILKQDVADEAIYVDILQIFNSKIDAMNRVFESFPIQPSIYKKDYAGIVQSTVDHYGLAEWKSIVLTNEVHGHTGIYSIIGAKAGIRACEYFNVGVNKLSAVSYAGSKPPLSCFNDGIQISTGATIGQGLIKVADEVKAVPTINFYYNGKKIRLILKKDVAERMQSDIKAAIQRFGFSTEYWNTIENLAKVYWTDFNRHDIFDIITL